MIRRWDKFSLHINFTFRAWYEVNPRQKETIGDIAQFWYQILFLVQQYNSCDAVNGMKNQLLLPERYSQISVEGYRKRDTKSHTCQEVKKWQWLIVSTLHLFYACGNFSDQLSHFQYATLEMFKTVLKNYSMLQLRFLINTHIFAMYCKNVFLQYYATTHNYSGHQNTHFIVELPQNRGRSMSFIFYLLQLLLLRSLFLLERRLKDIIIHFPYEISNDTYSVINSVVRYCP